MALQDDIIALLEGGPKSFEELYTAIGGDPEALSSQLDSLVLSGTVQQDTDTLIYSYEAVSTTLEEDDDAAIQLLADDICTPCESAENDVDYVLGTTGNTKAEWDRGNRNIGKIIELLRCEGLRSRLVASGVSEENLLKIDAMVDAAEVGHIVNGEMNAHHGNTGR